MSSGSNHQLTDQTLREKPDWAEELILGMALHDRAAFSIISRICYPIGGDQGTGDPLWTTAFEVPLFQTAYKLVYFVRGGFSEERQPDEIPKAVLMEQVAIMYQEKKLTPEQAQSMHAYLQKWYSSAFRQCVHMYKRHDLLQRWLKVRALHNVQTHLSLGSQANESKHKIIDRLRKELAILDELDNTAENPEMFFYDLDRVLDEEISMHPIVLPFPALQKALGTPLLLNESTLFGAVKGCGKTVLACQLAAYSGQAAVPTLLISTEERPQQLLLRSIAASCGLDIGGLRGSTIEAAALGGHGVRESAIVSTFKTMLGSAPAETRKSITERIELWRQYLCMYQWPTGAGSVEEHIHKVLDIFCKRQGRMPQLVIFDWVGGALSADDNKDLRLRYNDAVNTLVDMSKNHPMHTFEFCQLNTSALDRTNVGMQDIAESKSMPDRVTNFLAVTGLRNREAVAGTDNEGATAISPVFSKLQYFVCEKSRLGIPGKVRVVREFNYQRYALYEPNKHAGILHEHSDEAHTGGLLSPTAKGQPATAKKNSNSSPQGKNKAVQSLPNTARMN